MNITADTNVLVRVLTDDHPKQSKAARGELAGADMIALPLPALCELVWVLARGYKFACSDIAHALRRLMDSANVVLNRPAAEAGLAMLENGGDFADGVIAYEGRWLGGETFVSFDKEAIAHLTARGEPARLLS